MRKIVSSHLVFAQLNERTLPKEEPKLTFDDYLKQNPYQNTRSFTKEDWEADVWEKWNSLYNSKE
jgi:hypothetical protein